MEKVVVLLLEIKKKNISDEILKNVIKDWKLFGWYLIQRLFC